MKDYDINHTASSPYHLQANGQAERTVQTVKRLLVKAKDPCKALLDYRNSPLNTGFSPAQLFLGRRRKQYRRNRKMLRPTVVASRDSDLSVTVPSQSETECVLIKQVVRLHHNQMTTAKWSEKKMWKPDQAELSKFQLGFMMMTHKVYHYHAHGLCDQLSSDCDEELN